MTDSTLDINIRLGDAEKKVEKLDSKLTHLEKTGNKASKGADGLTQQFSRLKRQVIGLGAAYVSFRTVFDAVKTFRNFEQSVANLSAITGATGDDLQYLSDSARELGKVTTLSASQVATAFKLVASAKPDLLESVTALKQVTKETITLSEAAGIDLPQAADALGNALNQFSAGAEDASRFVNVLAAGAKFGAASIADAAMSLRDSGIVAASANISFEELNASVQILSTVGIKAQRAGVGLRNVILKLQKEGIDEINPAVVGLSTALKNLGKRNLDVTEMTKLFGLESIVAAQTLIKEANAIGTLTEKLTGTNIAYEQARINTDTLDGSIKRLESAYEELQLQLGENINPGLRGFIDLISEGLINLPSFISTVELFAITTVGEFDKVWEGIKYGAGVLASTLKTAFQTIGAAITAPIRLALEGIGIVFEEFAVRFQSILPEQTIATLLEASNTLGGISDAMLTHDDVSKQHIATVARLKAEYDSSTAVIESAIMQAHMEAGAREEIQKAITAQRIAKQALTDAYENSSESQQVAAIAKEMEDFEASLMKAEFQSGLLLDKMTLLDELFQNGAISSDVYSKGIEQISEAMGLVTDSTIDARLEAEAEAARLWGDLWRTTADNVSQGIGDAFADAIVEQKNLGEALKSVMKQVTKSVISGLIQIAIKRTLLNAKSLAEQEAIVAASVVEAGVVAASWAPAAAATSLASFGSNSAPAMAGISATHALSKSLALSGQAHDGMDNIPREGTYNLQKGEMVLDPGTSKKVRDNVVNATEGGGNINTVQVNLSAIDTESFVDRLGGDKMSEKIWNVIIDKMNEEGRSFA